MNKSFVYLIACMLLILPILTDFTETSSLTLLPFIQQLQHQELQKVPRIPPPDIFTLFETVQIIITVCYISTLQKGFWRLVIGMATLCLSGISLLLESLSRALQFSPFYGHAFNDLMWIAMYSDTIAIAIAAMGNLFVKKYNGVAVILTFLFVGSALGIVFSPVLSNQIRCYQIKFLGYTSKRFSISEFFYLISIAASLFLYFQEKAKFLLYLHYEPRILMLFKQYGLVHYYYKFVANQFFSVVDRRWEKSLVGSGLYIQKRQRQYYNVPRLSKMETYINDTFQKMRKDQRVIECGLLLFSSSFMLAFIA